MTVTVEGRERYPVNVRYMRDFRSDVYDLERVLVGGTGDRPQVQLSQLATIKPVSGPSMIRNEDGLLTGYVYVDLADRDPGSYIDGGRQADQGQRAAPGRLRRQLERRVRVAWCGCGSG